VKPHPENPVNRGSLPPFELGEKTKFTMSIKTIVTIVSAAVAITGWAIHQSMAVEELRDNQMTMNASTSQDHAILIQQTAALAVIDAKLELISAAQRGRPSAGVELKR
jgi:hypothetical protein